MPRDTSFHDYVVHDVLSEMHGITSKAMFGGWGIYKNGIIFGIIIEGELYFKVGDENRDEFEKMDSHPFTYSNKNGKSVTMSYWLVPEEVLEDRERVRILADQSVAINEKKKKQP